MAEDFDPKRCVKEVSEELLCAICFNVLKEPVSCGENEHYFCKSCINQHLVRSEACPLCNAKLTKNTLVKPSKLLKSMLSRLEVRCEYFDRGCQEVVLFEFIDNHVKMCEYSPVKCTNHNCKEEVSKRDLKHHEQVVCQYRQTKCHDCTRMAEEMKNLNASTSKENETMKAELDKISENQERMKAELAELSQNHEELKAELNTNTENQGQIQADLDKISQNQEGMKTELDRITENQDNLFQAQHQFSRQLEEMKSQLQKIIRLTENICPQTVVTHLEAKIIIIGSNSVDMFNYTDVKWTQLQPIKNGRSFPVSFMYNKQLFVCGGSVTKNIETLKTDVVDILTEKWVDSPIQLPNMLIGHCAEVYNDTLFLIGGHDGSKVSNNIWKVRLQPPYNQQPSNYMPEPRFYHGSVIIGDKIYLFGGYGKLNNFLNSVLIYDITGNNFQNFSPLPYPVAEMTVVKYKENIVVIGGCNKDEKALNKVFVYNTRSGRSAFLPSMITGRRGCAAVVINNEIFVTGGMDDKSKYLNTVEIFNFDLLCWNELPAMTESRAFHTAVII